ncbi:MAG: M48 family metallopeptidase [Candidatus Omnitrophota bacterium]
MPEMNRRKAYARLRYRLFFINSAFTLVLLVMYQFTLSAQLASLAAGMSHYFYAAAALYVTAFSAVMYTVMLPLHFYASYVLEHRFSLSNQNLWSWIIEEIKKGALSYLIFLFICMTFYAILRVSGGMWWVIVAAVWVGFSVLFTRVMPTLIIPLFYRYAPLGNAALKEKIRAIAVRSAVELIDIFQIDLSRKTRKANAAVVGIGKSRRVLLSDTLLAGFSDDEIGVVCAHEFGHHKLKHMPRLLIFSGISTLAGLFALSLLAGGIVSYSRAAGLYDLRIFPSLAAVLYIFSFIMMPLQNAYSRALERRADDFAIRVTADPDAFISLMTKLAGMNLADPDPPEIIKYLLYDHPPVSERLEMGEQRRQRADGRLAHG